MGNHAIYYMSLHAPDRQAAGGRKIIRKMVRLAALSCLVVFGWLIRGLAA